MAIPMAIIAEVIRDRRRLINKNDGTSAEHEAIARAMRAAGAP